MQILTLLTTYKREYSCQNMRMAGCFGHDLSAQNFSFFHTKDLTIFCSCPKIVYTTIFHFHFSSHSHLDNQMFFTAQLSLHCKGIIIC